VDRTFSDIRLDNRFYKVDPKLRGDRLRVRYDLRGPVEVILLYSLQDEYLGKGLVHQRQEGQEPAPAPHRTTPRFDLLALLIDKHRQQLAAESGGIDYSVMQRPRRWSFDAFAASLADLLGRSGGPSAFSAEELDALAKVHLRHPHLTRTLLKKAVAQAQRPTLPAIVYALQNPKED
jgi:hypothetical protein